MAESECSSGMVVVGSPTCITRHLLVCKIRELGHSHERLGEKLIDFYYEVGGNADYMIVKGCITQFLKTFRLKLKKYNRMYERFLEKETEWCSKYLLDEDSTCNAIAGPGRKAKNFKDCVIRTKKRKASEISSKHPTEALALATKHRAKSSPGQKDLGFVIDEAQKNPTKIKEVIENVKPVTRMSPENALALKINTGLSDEAYQKLRNACKIFCNADIFPTIHEIRDAKLSCYPKDLAISEVSASSNLQNLLDHTVSRLLETTDRETFFQNSPENTGTCYLKAGFDGASSQSIYAQAYNSINQDVAIINEQSMLQTAIVPLKITFGNRVLWENETPNSVKLCRPLKIEFIKETNDHQPNFKIESLDFSIK